MTNRFNQVREKIEHPLRSVVCAAVRGWLGVVWAVLTPGVGHKHSDAHEMWTAARPEVIVHHRRNGAMNLDVHTDQI